MKAQYGATQRSGGAGSRHPQDFAARYDAPGIGAKQDQPFVEPYKSGRMNSAALVRLGAHLPFVLFVVLLSLFTFWYHKFPVVPWFAAILGADVVLLSTWPLSAAGQFRDRWDWFPLISGLVAVGLGVSLGTLNYANFEPWVHANFLNQYDDVLPSANPMTVADSGILYFAEGSVLDVDKAAGYRSWPYTYCATPVVGASNSTPVGFWAVGVNCCESRGGFTCSDAQDSQARAGLRIESSGIAFVAGHTVRANFERAVRMSAAATGMQVAEAPIMMVWYKDPNAKANQSWWIATAVFLLMVLAAGGASYLCRAVLLKVRRPQW